MVSKSLLRFINQMLQFIRNLKELVTLLEIQTHVTLYQITASSVSILPMIKTNVRKY